MLNFTSDQWVIVALIFVLGLLVGGFLFSGGGRKWKHRYNAEVNRRTDLEKTHSQREKEWRDQDAERTAALREAERNRTVAAAPLAAAPLAARDARDVNRDGVVTPDERKPGIMDRMLGRDRDGDGVPDSREVDPRDRPLDPRDRPLDRDRDGYVDDRDGDGIPDRRDPRDDRGPL